MRKKLLFLFVTIMVVCFSAFTFTACAGNSETDTPKHTHTYANEWSSNETHHWAAATCEHTGEVAFFDVHTYVGGICVCGHEQVIPHVHTYSNAWSKNDTHHWKVATCEHESEVTSFGEHDFVNGVCLCGAVSDQVINENTDVNDIVSEYLTDAEITTALAKFNSTGIGKLYSNFSTRWERFKYLEGKIVSAEYEYGYINANKAEYILSDYSCAAYREITSDNTIKDYFLDDGKYVYNIVEKGYENYYNELLYSILCNSDFEYDTESKKYNVVPSVTLPGRFEEYEKISITFINGFICGVSFIGVKNVENILFYDYGNTASVILPEAEPYEPTPPPSQGAVKTINFTIETESSIAYQNAIRDLANKWNNEMYIKDDPVYGFKVVIGTTTGANAVAMIQGNMPPALIEIDDKYSRNVISNGLVTALSDVGTLATGMFDGNLIDRYKNGTNADGKMSPYATNAKLYAVPLQTSPATLYYNEGTFTGAGINIVYMTEEEALLAGLGAYGYHCYTDEELAGYAKKSELKKTKYNELVVNNAGKLDGSVAEKEGYRIFNARVAMSIEETFILSSVLTKAYNPGVYSTYGFNSEYWFPFGWTVGGDCVATNQANELVFSLSNTNANYLVTANTTVNGTSYKAGELLSYADKEYVAQYDVQDDALYAIPSISDVFSYFVAASVKKGQQVLWATNPNGTPVSETEKTNAMNAFGVDANGLKGFGIAFDPSSSTSYVSSFTSGESAMLYRSYDVSSDMQTGSIASNYNVAPTPQYKEYNADGTIKTKNGTPIKGYKSTMDANSGLYIPSKSQYKAEALTFLAWLLEEEQQMDLVAAKFTVTTDNQLVNDADYVNAFKSNYRSGFNAEVVLEAATYSTAPDWCYTSDDGCWVNNWTIPLNDQVRQGQRSLYSLFFVPSAGSELTVTQITNNALAEVAEYQVVSHKTYQ